MTPVLRTSGDTGAFAATWQPLANLLEVHAAPEEANDARLSEGEGDAIRDRREHSHEARGSRLGARWVAIDAEHCPAVPGEDMDPEECVVGNS